MTLLVLGALVFLALAGLAIWFLQRGAAEPAARAVESAPDAAEEERAKETASDHKAAQGAWLASESQSPR